MFSLGFKSIIQLQLHLWNGHCEVRLAGGAWERAGQRSREHGKLEMFTSITIMMMRDSWIDVWRKNHDSHSSRDLIFSMKNLQIMQNLFSKSSNDIKRWADYILNIKQLTENKCLQSMFSFRFAAVSALLTAERSTSPPHPLWFQLEEARGGKP